MLQNLHTLTNALTKQGGIVNPNKSKLIFVKIQVIMNHFEFDPVLLLSLLLLLLLLLLLS